MAKKRSLPFLPEIREIIYEIKHDVVEEHEHCGGTGYVPADMYGQIHRCDCMTVFRYLKELVKSCIPKDYWTLNLEDLHINPAVKRFTKLYLKNIHRARRNGLGVVFFGSNGVGKTSVMCEVGKEALVLGYSVQYFPLSNYVTAKFGKKHDAVASMESGDFLLIDELDKQSLSGNNLKVIDEFLRQMFNSGKSLFLATNWSEENLINSLGESAASLLRRRCEFIEMVGDDFSDELQDDYNSRLTEDFDYWHENILKMAIRFEDL